MYPQQELKKLTQTREQLQQRIMLHRNQCVEAAGALTPPLALLDRGLVVWRKLSPLAKIAAVPLVLFLKRKAASGPNVLGSLLSWAPGALSSLSSNN